MDNNWRAVRREIVTAPPELAGAVPREVRLTGSGVAAASAAIGLVIAALVSAIVMVVVHARGEDERELRTREAIGVEAQVMQVSARRGGHPRRIVTYSYEVEGRNYTGRSVLQQREPPIERGAFVPIAFLSSHPETSWRIGDEPRGFPLWPIPLIATAPLLAALGVVWGLRKQWVLLSEGRVAQARITEQKRVRSNKHKVYRVTYEFESLSGARHTGRYDATKTPPSVASLVPVVYHRDNPRWSALYPLSLVRPARAQRVTARARV